MGDDYGYGYSSGPKFGSIGYGTDAHTNAQKALFHGMKAARRWAKRGDYHEAARIAEACARAQLDEPDVEPLDFGAGAKHVDLEGWFYEQMKQAKAEVEDELYEAAAGTALEAALTYLLYEGEDDA